MNIIDMRMSHQFSVNTLTWKELVNLFVLKYVGGVIFDLIRCKIELTEPPHLSVPRRNAN